MSIPTWMGTDHPEWRLRAQECAEELRRMRMKVEMLAETFAATAEKFAEVGKRSEQAQLAWAADATRNLLEPTTDERRRIGDVNAQIRRGLSE